MTRRLAVLVAVLLIAGVVVGLVADDWLGSRPIATVVCGVIAAQVAMVMVYRNIVAALRRIGDDEGGGKEADTT